MKENVVYTVCSLLLACALAIGFWACDNESDSLNQPVEVDAGDPQQTVTVSFAELERFFDESPEKSAMLSGAFNLEQVTTAYNWITAQGYTYVDTNSVVFLIEHFTSEVDPGCVNEDPKDRMARLLPNDEKPQKLVKIDTVLWYAFESPTHSMANHTAIGVGLSAQSTPQVLFFELDVSQVPPVPIRQGRFVSGSFVSEELPMDDFFRCLGAGTLGGLVGCALTNGGYLQCVGGAAVGSAVICGLKSIFGW